MCRVCAQGISGHPLGQGKRLATESVTLLKNEKNLLPLGRDIKRVAVIGPHADRVMVGFPAYTHPAGVELLVARIGVKDFACTLFVSIWTLLTACSVGVAVFLYSRTGAALW
jgi:hypothetical protein